MSLTARIKRLTALYGDENGHVVEVRDVSVLSGVEGWMVGHIPLILVQFVCDIFVLLLVVQDPCHALCLHELVQIFIHWSALHVSSHEDECAIMLSKQLWDDPLFVSPAPWLIARI